MNDAQPASPRLPEAPAPGAGRARLGAMFLRPTVVLLMLLVAVAALLGALSRSESEEQRASLIADVLWLDQNIRFSLENIGDKLGQMAADLHGPGARFRTAAAVLLKQHSEATRIVVVDRKMLALDGLPDNLLSRLDPDPDGNAVLRDSIDRAFRLNKPVFSNHMSDAAGQAEIEWVFPAGRGDQRYAVVTELSLRTLFEQAVPWWFAEKYHVALLDADGHVLAEKGRLRNNTQFNYDLAFDAFGSALILRATAIEAPFNATQRFFVGAIVVLALAVVASLWNLRRQLTARLHAEDALRESDAFRRSMESSMLVGLRARDLEGRLIYVNPAFCRMVGFSEEELLGTLPPMPYWPPETMQETLRLHEAVMTGHAPPSGFEARLMRHDGTRFDALVYESPLIDGQGRHIGWMGSVLDITERKQAQEFTRLQQERLQHTARLVAMGEMASTLAHELNQPLAAIASYAEGGRRRAAQGRLGEAQLDELLERIATQSRRAGRIIRRVHDFLKKREPHREPTSIAEVVDEAVTLFEPQAKRWQIRLQRQLQGGLPDLPADATMIEQVVLNLLRNAGEAMNEAGIVSKRIVVRVEGDANTVRVRVCDNGPGLAPEVAAKLFTPFHTTKAEGLGMGLSICRSIIEFHHGSLHIGAAEEGGVCAEFFLPTGGEA